LRGKIYYEKWNIRDEKGGGQEAINQKDLRGF
jgi:hypothetical protein